ncbi:hypothetical protein N0O92_14370 [Alkalihalobacillus sp. MEB130]|uniref:hypothetical protein n=1 Tax=Alkalihalobacillus sp. MEB130 TaxID=2976704 RepID=UPI0028DE6E77|nr:hypothetical protein [Alkalihalobacillus sp. MEB130]MDT8861403.1 hypothetical protein [Alkalihalobacillus sp. MEB130]
MYQVPERQLLAYQLCYEIEMQLRELIQTYDMNGLKMKLKTYKDVVSVVSKLTLVDTGESVDKLIRANTVREKVSRMKNVSDEDIWILEECRDSLPKINLNR